MAANAQLAMRQTSGLPYSSGAYAAAVAQHQAMLSAAKAAPGDPAAMAQLATAEQGLAGALSRLMVVSEQYPDLSAVIVQFGYRFRP